MLAAVFLLLTGRALAADYLPSGHLPQPKSPIQIEACPAYVFDNSRVGINCAFVNRDPTRTAVVVRFLFSFDDAFGDVVFTLRDEASGTYSPGARIELRGNRMLPESPYWQYTVGYKNVRQLMVAVDRVLFSDGSTYVSDIPSEIKEAMKPRPTPTPFPIEFPR